MVLVWLWCAVFVSWVANQVGYIEKGLIPKFSVCETGANRFKVQGRWKNNTYIPKPGDIIFLIGKMMVKLIT